MSSVRQRQTLYMLYEQGYIDSRLCSYLDEVYYEQPTHIQWYLPLSRSRPASQAPPLRVCAVLACFLSI